MGAYIWCFTLSDTTDSLLIEWEDATRQAFDALARYKFWMFGYHAARVVYIGTLLNRIGGIKIANPFVRLVQEARKAYCGDCGELRGEGHICTSESLRWRSPVQQMLLLANAQQSADSQQEGT